MSSQKSIHAAFTIPFFLSVILVSVVAPHSSRGQSADFGYLKGTVTANREALFGAAVYWAAHPETGVFTQGGGYFELPLPSVFTPDTLVVEYLGYNPYREAVESPSTAAPVRIQLKSSAVAIAEIAVTANRTTGMIFAPQQLSQLDIYISPNSSADPLKAVQNVPGATVTDETANPVLRGSGAGRNRVLYNGVPIRNPVRNSTINGLGYFSILSPEFVDRLDVYPSTPPISRAATAGGLLDVHSVNRLSADQTQVSLSLASMGVYAARKIGGKENHFLQVFANQQLSAPFKAINGERFKFLRDFSNTNVGLNYHRGIGKFASLNIFSSAMVESSEIEAPFLNHKGIALTSGKRWFNVINFKYFKNKLALTFNSGSNFNAPSYSFGNIRSDFWETNLHHAAYADYYASEGLTLRAGVLHEYHRYDFTNRYPLRFFAFREGDEALRQDTLITLHHPELLLYGDWQFAPRLRLGIGVRRNVPVANVETYWSRQASLRFDPAPGHRISAAVGRYYDYFTPNFNVQSFELLSSDQWTLEYEWRSSDKLTISTALYHKREQGVIDISRPEIGSLYIWGAEFGIRGNPTRRFSYFLNLTHLDKQIELPDGRVPARDDLAYLLVGGVQYLSAKGDILSLTVNARPGLRYTPVIGGMPEPAFDAYQPLYGPDVNGSRLGNYRKVSLGYSRSFPIKKGLSLLAFVNLANLENRANDQGVFYSTNYDRVLINEFPGLAIYFGGILNW